MGQAVAGGSADGSQFFWHKYGTENQLGTNGPVHKHASKRVVCDEKMFVV